MYLLGEVTLKREKEANLSIKTYKSAIFIVKIFIEAVSYLTS